MRPPSTLLQLNAILVLFCAAAMLFTNEADGQQDTLGLGGFPVPAKGEVDLPSGIVLVNDKDKFDEYYKDAKVKPCNVDFDKEGNIEVLYDNLASTKGCTVDLLVNKTDQIEFVAKVEDKEKNCVTEEFNDNLLPFIFNEANNQVAALTNGPEYGGDEFCANKTKCENNKGKCIKRTMFEIGWMRPSPGSVFCRIGQVAEPVVFLLIGADVLNSDEAKLNVQMAVGNVPKDKPLVTIALDVDNAVPFKFPGEENQVCNKPRKATPPPAIWKVNSGEFKDKYFVTFHFFPQKSAGAGGPNCNASFFFSMDFALGILAIPKLPTTTTKTTIGSTTTEIGSSKTTMGTGSTTPNGTKNAGPEPTGSLSTGTIVGIVAGSVLVVAIIVAVLVYCLCCRNGKDAPTSEDDEHLENAEGGTAGHAGGNDTANS